MKQRLTLARVDNDDRKRKIQMARRIIYEQKYAVNCEAVEKLLKEESLVPTSVRTEKKNLRAHPLTNFNRMRFQNV